MCVESTTHFVFASSRMRLRISTIWCGSRPVVGSSRITTSGSWMSARAADEREALADFHREVERQRLREIADALAHLERVLDDVEPRDGRRPRGRDEVRREDAHRRRLAG